MSNDIKMYYRLNVCHLVNVPVAKIFVFSINSLVDILLKVDIFVP